MGDGERAEEPGTKLGAGVLGEGEVISGQSHTVTDFEGEVTTMTVGLFSLASLGQLQFLGDDSLDGTHGVQVGRGRRRGLRAKQSRWSSWMETEVGVEG